MRPHRARPTLAPSRGTPGACGNRSGALHLLYFWNMYFYVLEISFIEILAAFEFSPNSVEFSNSTFKFWPNSTGSQILPSNSGRILQSFKFCLPNSGWNWEPRYMNGVWGYQTHRRNGMDLNTVRVSFSKTHCQKQPSKLYCRVFCVAVVNGISGRTYR